MCNVLFSPDVDVGLVELGADRVRAGRGTKEGGRRREGGRRDGGGKEERGRRERGGREEEEARDYCNYSTASRDRYL